ncbi:MAG: glycoside hydrolase family 2 protein [Parabacteroides sp.]|nr:glycoside hydrolase family 2 protein [Parabacteroides sp.]
MKKILVFIVLLSAVFPAAAVRKSILLNNDWNFRFSYQVRPGTERRVDLPHTWNASDALAGEENYARGVGNYQKELFVPADWKGKRLFLRFEGANTVTNLFINQKHIGEHRGGYGAFVFEITDRVNYGRTNQLLVRVNNALNLDVMPLVGDFNFYGGIYRDVYLVITDQACISPLDYASPGVYLVQENVSREKAGVQAKVVLSNAAASSRRTEVNVAVYDGNKIVVQQRQPVVLPANGSQTVTVPLQIRNPRLWNGRKDPFVYRTEITLLADGKEIDKVVQPLGLRFYRVDAEEGFFLNGEHLKLQGVCRHQDRAEIGNALRPMHHDEDMAIITEMGANAIRLAHYPQATYFYDLADRNGLVVWAEIPFIGPGGYLDRGYVNQPSFRANGKEQLKELIRQHYNHPSICFWGLYNELKTIGDSPEEYIRELNALAHEEDPTRLTTAASFLEDENTLNGVTDVVAWNKYYGWYGGSPADMGKWADANHKAFPQYKIAISEYGAGASIYHQQDSVKAGVSSGWWHPENWQTYYHIGNWQAIAERPYIWGSFIWNLFDFGAAHRAEGDRPGINDKGLVTFDRKVKKDAYYFYKANWNKSDKFVYIANRRHIRRTAPVTDVTVFSNLPETELFVNGKSYGRQQPDSYATFVWKGVQLSPGKNTVEVKAAGKKAAVSDCVEWNLN